MCLCLCVSVCVFVFVARKRQTRSSVSVRLHFVSDHWEHYIAIPMNPSGSDVALLSLKYK